MVPQVSLPAFKKSSNAVLSRARLVARRLHAVVSRRERAASRVARSRQGRVDAAERHFLTRAVDEPGRVGFSTDRRPDLLLQVVRDRSPDRAS
jgi:hypothetical protein